MHPNTCLQDKFPVAHVELLDLVSWGHLANFWQFEETASLGRGGVLSKAKGRGMEFEDVRLYQMGDDIRHIDWRVTARTGKPHTKRFIEEKDSNLMVVLDFRPAMFFATFGVYKAVMASHIAAFLLWMGKSKGDALGLSLCDEPGCYLRPSRHRSQITELLKSIANHPRWNNHRGARSATSNSTDILEGLNSLKSGSKVVLITDLRGLNTEHFKKLSRLSQQKKVSLILITDKLEESLPTAPVSLMYNGQQVDIKATHDEQIKHANQFKQRLEDIQHACHLQGIELCHLRTHEPYLLKLIRNLHLKKK